MVNLIRGFNRLSEALEKQKVKAPHVSPDDAPQDVSPARKPSSTRKYICPHCGMSVRATKEVRIMCVDCMEVMEKAD